MPLMIRSKPMRHTTLLIGFLLSCFALSAQSSKDSLNQHYSKFYKDIKRSGLLAPAPMIRGKADHLLYGRIPAYFRINRQNAGYIVSIESEIHIRQMLELSLPVRTPSYYISFNVAHHWSPSKNKIHYSEVDITHHSNGLQKSPWMDNEYGVLNTVDGSFSTNYMNFEHTIGTYLSTGRSSTHHFGIEIHPQIFEFDDESDVDVMSQFNIRHHLGRSRLNYTYNNVLRKYGQESSRWSIESTFVFEKRNAGFSDRINLMATYNKQFKNSDLGWFVSTGWLGHDFYNIYFNSPGLSMWGGVSARL